MNGTWRTEVPLILLIVAMVALAAFSWSRVPERIPVHWNAAGQVDRVGGKLEGLLLLPAATVAVYVLTLLLPRVDPGFANYRWFAGAYTVIRLALITFMAGTYGAIIVQLFGKPVQMPAVVAFFVGGLFLIIGDQMAKIRPNWFVGIRTPWTLSSKLSWNKTHRLGGWLFIAAGLAIITTAVLRPEWSAYVILSTVIGTVIWTMIYSYRVWRSDPEKLPPAGTLPAERL